MAVVPGARRVAAVPGARRVAVVPGARRVAAVPGARIPLRKLKHPLDAMRRDQLHGAGHPAEVLDPTAGELDLAIQINGLGADEADDPPKRIMLAAEQIVVAEAIGQAVQPAAALGALGPVGRDDDGADLAGPLEAAVAPADRVGGAERVSVRGEIGGCCHAASPEAGGASGGTVQKMHYAVNSLCAANARNRLGRVLVLPAHRARCCNQCIGCTVGQVLNQAGQLALAIGPR